MSENELDEELHWWNPHDSNLSAESRVGCGLSIYIREGSCEGRRKTRAPGNVTCPGCLEYLSKQKADPTRDELERTRERVVELEEEVERLGERWGKLREKVERTTENLLARFEAQRSELGDVATDLLTLPMFEHADQNEKTTQLLLKVDEMRRTYAIYDALRSVLLWTDGYL